MEKAKQMKYHLRKTAFDLAAVLASAQVKTRAQTKIAQEAALTEISRLESSINDKLVSDNVKKSITDSVHKEEIQELQAEMSQVVDG
ncbi:UNVERIFIED_CONTAM: hypothetical protein KB581_00205 [Streptococcus canis]|uniref:Uncharacterized protein n=1 Tax=Streptococcus canis TaxID=1329 RepID=A0AAE4Q5L1_STRCB|nr:hypothetical protein [Streptococcus canis]MDV5976763.1 hypothetical protein [Streptococcus canis]